MSITKMVARNLKLSNSQLLQAIKCNNDAISSHSKDRTRALELYGDALKYSMVFSPCHDIAENINSIQGDNFLYIHTEILTLDKPLDISMSVFHRCGCLSEFHYFVTIIILYNSSLLLREIGEIQAAFEFLTKVEMNSRMFSLEVLHSSFLMSLHYHLGCTYSSLGDLISAQASFAKAIRYGIKWIQVENVDFVLLAIVCSAMGNCLLTQGEVNDSRSAYDNAKNFFNQPRMQDTEGECRKTGSAPAA